MVGRTLTSSTAWSHVLGARYDAVTLPDTDRAGTHYTAPLDADESLADDGTYETVAHMNQVTTSPQPTYGWGDGDGSSAMPTNMEQLASPALVDDDVPPPLPMQKAHLGWTRTVWGSG
eukprot:m.360701 g.360701  ORF g.360701 m.360701 type:complete len:118 (-) comp28046_c1_seq9:3069-3422(-)